MSIKYDKYMPLYAYLSPASIPQIVAHIQDYLVKHPILSVETIAEIIVQSLQEHPELINGTAIPISADSEQSIKAYIDSLPSVDTYTKAEINLLLTGKQDTLTFDQAPTPGSSNPVTSSGIIAALSALQTALETQIGLKADSASTYTKSQVDTLLTDKANTDDVYSKNTMDAKLLEYATSDSVYSKTDINTMKQVNKANLAIVSSDGTAPLDITAGQYVYMDDVLFMATENILTGARLIPNSNIVLNPTGVTNRIGDGLKNAVTQINGLTETVSNQSQQIDDLQNGLAYVETGDVASRRYTSGEFLIWKNVLYTVTNDIPQGNTIEGNVTIATSSLNGIKEIIKTSIDQYAITVFCQGNSSATFTLPDNGIYLFTSGAWEPAVFYAAFWIGYVSASRFREYKITPNSSLVIDHSDTTGLTFTITNNYGAPISMYIYYLGHI